MKSWTWKWMGIFALGVLAAAAAGGAAGFRAGPVPVGLLGLVAAVVLTVFGVWLGQLLRGLERLLDGLQKEQDVLSGKWPASLRPLQEALRDYAARHQQYARQTESQNRDLALHLQVLQRQKTSAQAILQSIRDAVLVTDAQDRIVLANAAAEQLLDFQFNPEQPESLDTAIGDQALRDYIRKSRNGRIRHVRHELTFLREGRPQVFDAVFSCLFDSPDTATGVVAVLHDITREKEISQMKNEFVSHVSHELKTPLASINAYAEMLVDGEAQDAETIRQFCSIIQSQALRLNRLIEDILNISRIESGLVKVHREEHSIALVIRDAVEMIHSYAQEKNITIHSQAPILYDRAYVDRDMISQVVINLLSNAVKYTPAGGSITIGSEVHEADGRIVVTVRDTGVGIPPEDVDHVFEKFYRVEANRKIAKGTGLGLNLVKQIVETVHGGKVFVSSKTGEGSTFGFELPLAAADRQATTV